VALADWQATALAYLALAKPRIIELLLVTTIPAMFLAAGGFPEWQLVVWTLVGGTAAAGSANVFNSVLDADIDARMRRTRRRPMARDLVSPPKAIAFGAVLGVLATLVLGFGANWLSAALALVANLYYVFVYTMALKRRTSQNIVWGGIAGCFPPLIGWTAVTGTIGLEGVLLFLIVFYWQPPHFWALALGLTEDYRAANVPMMPVVLGEHETKRQIVLYATLTAAISLVFGVIAGLGALYLAVAVAGGAGFVWFAIHVYRTPGIGGTRAMFRYSTSYLALLFAAMVADRLLIG
jgi:protoheme IX farnesyltransferase